MSDVDGEIYIRKMIEEDIDAMLNLAGSLISREDMSAINPSEPKINFSFVAIANEHIIGFILARLLYIGVPLTKLCAIHGIVVDHEYRRKGIGNRLIDELGNFCRQEGVHTIRALVEESDDELQHFTEQMGFRRSSVYNYDMVL